MRTKELPIPIPDDKNLIYPASQLDKVKPLIETKITHPALIIPSRLTSKVRSSLKEILMNKPKLKDVYNLLPQDAHPDESMNIDPKSERKIALTDHHESYPDIYEHPSIQELFNDRSIPTIRKATHDLIIGYDHFAVDQVLTKILPKELSEIPSSFEVIGNLAHITLREEYHPYKYIIGRTILDKNRGIKVVVNKIGTIQNEFRTFPMEIIADSRKKTNVHTNTQKLQEGGGLGLVVEVKEDGCRFQLDFEKVYWNSRLQYEHRRIVHLIAGKVRPTNVKKRADHGKKKKDDGIIAAATTTTTNTTTTPGFDTQQEEKIIVADACAGIGPFAIPLSSQYSNIEVYANDLNPVSYRYLQSNAKLNKCGKHLHAYNMDGRYFLRKLDDEGIQYDHVLMNLPAIAPEFLNVFSGWRGDSSRRPMIHVHCFAKKVGGDMEAVKRCGKSLGCELELERDEVSVHEVRNVSPKKNMYCVSFRLPEAAKDVVRVEEFGPIVVDADEEGEGEEKGNEDDGNEHVAKKARTS